MAALDEDSCLKMFPQPRPTRQDRTESIGLEDKGDNDKPQDIDKPQEEDEDEEEEEEEPEVVQKKSDDIREEHVPEIQPIEQVIQCLQ